MRMMHTLLTCWSTQALGRAIDWLGVTRREERIECACGRDHRAKRASNFSHAFTPAMLQEAQKQAAAPIKVVGERVTLQVDCGRLRAHLEAARY